MLLFWETRELGLKVEFQIVLLGRHKIESKLGFSIWRGPDGGVTEGEGGSVIVPLVTLYLSCFPGGVSYVIVLVVKYTPLTI
jgi:hypothetical protein